MAKIMARSKKLLNHPLASSLIIWLFITFVWFFYRYFFRLPEWLDELFFKPLMFLTPVLLWTRFKEKKKLESLGLSKFALIKSLLVGFGLGLVFSLEGVLTSWVKYGGLVFNPKNLSDGEILGMGVVSLATAFSEEILYRGFLMNRFWVLFKSEVLANLLSTALFVFGHLPMALFVLGYSGRDLFAYQFLIFVLGAADGFVFGRTRNIAAPAVSHALWNWSVILVR